MMSRSITLKGKKKYHCMYGSDSVDLLHRNTALQSWSTLVEGDQPPYRPCQLATQSMNVNIICFTCE